MPIRWLGHLATAIRSGARGEYVDTFRAYFGYVQNRLAELITVEDRRSFVGQAITDPTGDPQLADLSAHAVLAFAGPCFTGLLSFCHRTQNRSAPPRSGVCA